MPCRMCEMRCRSVVLLIVARHLINAGRPTLLWIIVRSIVRCCCTTVNERWRGCNAGTVVTPVTGGGRAHVLRVAAYPDVHCARAVTVRANVAGVPLAASVVGRQ